MDTEKEQKNLPHNKNLENNGIFFLFLKKKKVQIGYMHKLVAECSYLVGSSHKLTVQIKTEKCPDCR